MTDCFTTTRYYRSQINLFSLWRPFPAWWLRLYCSSQTPKESSCRRSCLPWRRRGWPWVLWQRFPLWLDSIGTVHKWASEQPSFLPARCRNSHRLQSVNNMSEHALQGRVEVTHATKQTMLHANAYQALFVPFHQYVLLVIENIRFASRM